MPRKVTLKDVAAKAGVSFQTVSKVLNKQAQVSKETEKLIIDAVEALNYRPNYVARSLRSQRTRMIGYSWSPSSPDQANPILDQFLQSMLVAAEQADYYLLCFPHHLEGDQIHFYRELIDTNRVDAFVVSGVEYNDPRIAFLLERRFPFVAFGHSNPDWNFPYVDVDGVYGMYQVGAHLTGLGHRRIAILAWPESSRVGQDRLNGLMAALNEAGISVSQAWLKRGEGTYQFGRDATSQLLDISEPLMPSAIVAFNDTMAVGAMHEIQARGLRVGIDVAVTGFDDAPMAQYLTPGLTSVHQPVWEVGQHCVRLLLDILANQDIKTPGALVPPLLKVRGSSQLPPLDSGDPKRRL